MKFLSEAEILRIFFLQIGEVCLVSVEMQLERFERLPDLFLRQWSCFPFFWSVSWSVSRITQIPSFLLLDPLRQPDPFRPAALYREKDGR